MFKTENQLSLPMSARTEASVK